VFRLKRPWSNGTTHLKFTGTEWIERLTSLVTRPRMNLVRYHGVLAPNARLRPEVIRPSQQEANAAINDKNKRSRRRRYYDRAELMRRVFEFDVSHCPRCDVVGMQVIACIQEPVVIRKILRHLGQPAAPPRLEAATDLYEGGDIDVA